MSGTHEIIRSGNNTLSGAAKDGYLSSKPREGVSDLEMWLYYCQLPVNW